jgi:ubiquinone biosynthesis protein COQ9
MTSRDSFLEPLRDRILRAVVKNVPFDGWTEAALRAALIAEGLKPFDAARAFPGGVGEIVEFYLVDLDARMTQALASQTLSIMKVHERIILAIETRLELFAGEKETASRTLAYFALPMHAAAGLRALYRTVDTIWRLAGDTSTDFNFYTKRALLAWVYSATLLTFLNDDSENFEETRAFLRRRIDEVMAVGKRLGGAFKKKRYA